MSNKIDFVITWLDDNDPEWLLERSNKYPDKEFDEARFRDWGLLKYWFRGVDEFAPWVNHIYFITWGHIPEFLDVNHPKITIVKHKDYLDPKYLPTYSSNAIELSMHKIKGLSEQFVYFNDDSYIIKEVSETDFFENNLPKDVAILNPIVPKYYGSVSNVMTNNMAVINQNFSFRKSFKENKGKWLSTKYKKLLPLNLMFQPWSSAVGLYQQHLPSSFLKSTFDKVWEKEYDILHETSLRNFRSNFMDINQWLLKKWQVMEGNFSPRNIDFGKYIMVKDLEQVNDFKKAIDNKNNKLACLNDHIESDEIDEIVDAIVIELEKILPNKSSFEI